VFGRSEQLKLTNHQGEKISIELWGKQIFNKLTRLAEILDKYNDSNTFQNSVKAHYKKLEAIDQLPSSAIVKTVESGNGDFEGFGLESALINRELYRFKQIKAS
jgi:gamma-glutamylcysteine synthetase